MTAAASKEYSLKDVVTELKKSNHKLDTVTLELKAALAEILFVSFGRHDDQSASETNNPTVSSDPNSKGVKPFAPKKSQRTLGGDIAEFGKGMLDFPIDAFKYLAGVKSEDVEEKPAVEAVEDSTIIVNKLDEQLHELRSLSSVFTKVLGELVVLRKVTEGRIKYDKKAKGGVEYRDSAGRYMKIGTERQVEPQKPTRPLVDPTTSDVDKEQTQAYRIQQEAQAEAFAEAMPTGGPAIPGVDIDLPGGDLQVPGGAADGKSQKKKATVSSKTPRKGRVPKGGGKLLMGAGLLAAGTALYEGVTGWQDVEARQEAGTITAKEANVEKGGVVGSAGGGLGGSIAGAKLGATIGTAILPGVGTAVGTVLGGIGGYIAGSTFGEGIGQRVVEHNQRSLAERKAIGQKNLGLDKRDKAQAERVKKYSRDEVIKQNKLRKSLGQPLLSVPADVAPVVKRAATQPPTKTITAPVVVAPAATQPPTETIAAPAVVAPTVSAPAPVEPTSAPVKPTPVAPTQTPDMRGGMLQAESVASKEISSPTHPAAPPPQPIISNNVVTNNAQSFVPIKPSPRLSSTSFMRFQDRVAMG